MDKLGIENEFNAPWCDDWARFMLDKLTDVLSERVVIGGKEVLLSTLLRFEKVQTNWPGGYQHNYVILRPYGHQLNKTASPDDHGANPHILFFDPWFSIYPDVYLRGGHCAPTHWGASMIFE
jgi:hypothetical protein